MGKLLNVLNEKDRGEKILTIVLKLAHDDKDETSRIIAVQVINMLSIQMFVAFNKDGSYIR